MIQIFFTPVLLLLICGSVFAQSNLKWPVFVDHTGDDYIGRQLTFQTIAKLKSSSVYTPLDSAFNGELGFFRMMITSVATTETEEWSAISVVYTLEFPGSPFGNYLNSAIYFRNAKNLTDLAEKVIHNLDTAIKNHSTWQEIKDRR